MSISYRVLGNPGWDNGLYVKINNGQGVYRLLFDCGENILNDLSLREIKSIDYLFISHFHIDHIAGFDYFFRRNYNRENKPVYIFGPEGTIKMIHNRLRGFKWNLVKGVAGLWYVAEINDKKQSTCLFRTSEGYSVKHNVDKRLFNGTIINNPTFLVNVTFLNHIIPSAAYYVKEKQALNINKEKLIETGFNPGIWLEKVRDLSVKASGEISVDGKSYKLKILRDKLLERKEGESVGYLTDFIYDRVSAAKIKEVFKGCDTLICESQYLPKDKKLAKKNFHLTAVQAARLAKSAKAKKLILFHISDRYRKSDYSGLIGEAREIFPNTFLPDTWNIKY